MPWYITIYTHSDLYTHLHNLSPISPDSHTFIITQIDTHDIHSKVMHLHRNLHPAHTCAQTPTSPLITHHLPHSYLKEMLVLTCYLSISTHRHTKTTHTLDNLRIQPTCIARDTYCHTLRYPSPHSHHVCWDTGVRLCTCS